MNKTDYAGLTDAELTRAVAEKRGWHDLEPFGYEMMIGNRYHKKVFYEGTDPETGEAHEQVPDYPADVRVALRLLCEMDGFTIRYYIGIQEWAVEFYTGKGIAIGYGNAPVPARAICIAWLAWKDEQE